MARELIGRYEILETLGKGAMGVVYLARDPIIDRNVALKTLRIDLDPDCAGEFRERFFREARAAGRLSHPGIVTIHDVGECPQTGLVYIAMEHIKGQDLKQMLGPDRRLHPAEAARIIAEVALALDYAHNLGVIHRDIKPANIILTSGGTAKVMDFGVARLESSNLTVDGQFIGTPNFMAPEQITGQAVDARSDVFSLGVVLFNLLTGRRPFQGANMHDVTLKIVREDCPIPSTLVPGIPPAFNPIVLRCLEKDPDRRYQSAAALAEALGALARVLAPRSEVDAGRTVATSGHHPAPAPPPEPAPSPGARLWSRLKSVPVPEWFHWPIHDRWAWSAVGAAASILALVIAGMSLMIDDGPWPSPSAAGIAGRHQVVRTFIEARRLLERGAVAEAEAACQRGLDQAPSSPGGRALARDIHRALEQEQTILAGRARVEALVDEGRALYREGTFPEAIEVLDQALAVDPDHELAGSYRELAAERLKSTEPVSAQRRPAATEPRARVGTRTAQTVPRSVPTPGLARIELRFDSPLNSGHFTVTLDGESLEEIPFDFTTRNRLGFKRKGTGTVRRTLIAPSGRHEVGIRLSSPDLKAPAVARFTKNLSAGSRWSLRADLPSKKAAPSFFLIRAD